MTVRDMKTAGDRAIYKGRTGGEMLWVVDEYDLRIAHATVSHEYD